MKQLFYFLIFQLFTYNSSAQLLNDSESKQLIVKGLDKLYNYEFKEADAFFQKVKLKYPNHPVTPLLNAFQLQWNNMPIENNPKALSQYIILLEKCSTMAETLVKKNELNAEGNFFKVAAHGYIALGLHYKDEQMKAANEARKVYPYFKDSMKQTNINPEFLFTTGLYNFYRVQYPEAHPITKPVMLFFENGNKKLGLQQLEQAVQKTTFSRIEAAYYLVEIYLKYESNYAKALYYSTWLHEKYPNNLLYKMRHIESLLMNNKLDEALPLLASFKKTNDKVYSLAERLFEGMINEKYKKNDKLATEAYQSVIKMQPNQRYTYDYYAMAYAGLARIAVRENNQSLAKEMYKKSLNYADYKSVIAEAKKFLD